VARDLRLDNVAAAKLIHRTARAGEKMLRVGSAPRPGTA
jgi:hypothetical protein